jgi:4,5-DOPA dioxygenase extradiol
MDTNTLPPVFLSHGSPMTALEPREAGLWWRGLGERLAVAGTRPRAVLVASAHSLTREPVLLAAAHHEAVHDFGGFDERLYAMRYDAPGDPGLAERAATLLRGAGLPVHLRPQGGLDHGIWVPLRELFPAADVPVLPLAWPPGWTPTQLFALGRALAPLVAWRLARRGRMNGARISAVSRQAAASGEKLGPPACQVGPFPRRVTLAASPDPE